MARPVTLFTGQWADLPLETLAKKASSWGLDGLELACWGDHFDVARAVREPGYAQGQRELLARHGLECWAIGDHLVGQCVCDPIDERHRGILPPGIWGDGEPEGVRQRAAERMKDGARAAAQLGVQQVNGFTGSGAWHLIYSFPPNDFAAIDRAYEEFADRIYHVHVKDSRKRLDGRRSILGSHLNLGDGDRGWDFVSPGHGDVDFEELFRALNRIGYLGPLSIEWEDSGMEREWGVQDAVGFVRRTDFVPSELAFDAAMQRER